MQVTNTERIYCFELTERQFRRLLARDSRALETTGTLCLTLCKMDGVRAVEYDPFFGCFVVVRIEEPFDTVLENVKKALAKYVR